MPPEPSAKPEFIRNNKTRLSYLSNGTEVLVPCRATHMNLHVILWQFDVRVMNSKNYIETVQQNDVTIDFRVITVR